MRVFVAILCALAVCFGQYFTGSGLRPALAFPSYLALGVAGLLSVPLAWNRAFALPRWDCVAFAGAFVLWAFFREVTSPEPWMAGAFFRLTLGCWVMYLIVASALATPAARVWFLVVLMGVGLVQAGLGAAQFGGVLGRCPQGWFSEFHRSYLDGSLLQAGQIMRRASGLYQNANHLAWFLNAVGLFGIAMACLGRGRAWQKVVYAYVGVACSAAGLLCLSRGGILGWVAGSLVILVLAIVAIFVSGTGRRWTLTALLVAAVVIPAVTLSLFASQSIEVQTRMNVLFADAYRPEIWKTSLRHLQVNPLSGTGAGTFVEFSRRFRDGASTYDDYQAHNDWLQVAGEYGVVGFSLLLLALVVHLHAGWQGYVSALKARLAVGSLPQSNSAALLMGAMAVAVTFAVHSLVDFNLQVVPNALLAAVVAGILAGSRPDYVAGVARQAPKSGRIAYSVLVGVSALGLLTAVWISRGELWALMAENDLLAGRQGEADRSAALALKSAPDNPWVQAVGGRVAAAGAGALSGSDRAEEKRIETEHFLEAVAISSGDRVLRSALVSALMVEGKWGLARTEVIRSIEMDPLRATGWEQLGMIAQLEGNLPMAVRYYGVASSLTGSSVDWKKLKVLQDRVRARAAEAR